MVRFIQRCQPEQATSLTMSQFHYGSIHTDRHNLPIIRLSCVSIPLWFDSYRTIMELKPKREIKSQFHYGSIHTLKTASHAPSMGGSQFHYGSIHTNACPLMRILWQLSQFHYGSIHTIFIMHLSYLYGMGLNSTMVRFILSGATAATSSVSVSIPLWFDSYKKRPKGR